MRERDVNEWFLGTPSQWLQGENPQEDTDFTDVTLASDDRQQIAAHKIILSASSPFLREILDWRNWGEGWVIGETGERDG